MKKVAVILLNLGGPSSLSAVRPFLFNLFYDRAILGVPNPLRWILSKFISWRRSKEAKEIYKKLGGKSPLLEETEAQRKKLEKILNEEGGDRFKVFVSMRYWHPFSRQVAKEVSLFNPTETVLLPLYPQFSTTTSASSVKDFKKELNPSFFIKTIPCFFYTEGFLSSMEKGVRKIYKDAKKFGTPRILWTAHGLPKKIIEKGDPYQRQVEETVYLLIKRLKDLNFSHEICYQSRVGPLEWIGPYTENEIIKGGKEGVPLIIVPISFVSEHSETLVELDMDYKVLAIDSGVPFYGRVSTVRTDQEFLKGLSNLIKETEKKCIHCPNTKKKFCCLNLQKFYK